MNAIFKGVLAMILLVFFSCGKEKNNAADSHESEEMHWSYSGETSPEHWAELEKNSDCSGEHQSPVNILDGQTIKDEGERCSLDFYYSPKTLLNNVRNNGHSIQFDFELGDSLAYNHVNYNLVQIHFHEPSEHLINGVRYPIEIHLVHQSQQQDYTVVSVLGIEGEDCETIENMESYLPLKKGEEKEIHESLDLSSIFPEKKSYYFYEGSLTTPPCTENVQWVIFKDPVKVSLEEVLKLRDNMPFENYRNEQPLNGRKVYLHEM